MWARERKGLLLLLGLVGLALVGAFLPLREWLLQAASGIAALGFSGPFLYGLFYIVSSLLIPSSLLSLAAAFLFGAWTGFVVMNLGAVLGACLGFWIARRFARSWIESKIAAEPRWSALDRATQCDGWKIVLLTRLAPIFPYILLNYAYGLSAVRFRDYLLATWAGMIPSGLAFAYLGAAARNLAELGGDSEGMLQSWMFWAGIVATALALLGITVWARRALRQGLASGESLR